LIILATLRYFNKKGVDYDPLTPYKHNKGKFRKFVQNPPQAFNIDHFSHPARFLQKKSRLRSPRTIPIKYEGGFLKYVQNPPLCSILFTLATYDILTKIGVETDTPTPYLHNESRFLKVVQNPPQAFNFDQFR